jgi:hypothetical protein
MVSRKPLGSLTSKARLFHSVSRGSDLSVMPAFFARFAISSTLPAPLLPIVLVQADLGPARAQHDAEQRPVLLPPLVDPEAERARLPLPSRWLFTFARPLPLQVGISSASAAG